MNIPQTYIVETIEGRLAWEWFLKKDYAKAIPNIKYCFALLDKDNITHGVCAFGTPANNHNNEQSGFKQFELVRLVVNEGLKKNVLSYFVANALKRLPQPMSVISYADEGKNHHGYIYQATNWIYTGKGGGVDFYLSSENKEIHSRVMSDWRLKYPAMTRDEIATMLKWEKKKGTYKHRYFAFSGNKRDKKQWLKGVTERFSIEKYPKGDNERYDACFKPVIQTRLF